MTKRQRSVAASGILVASWPSSSRREIVLIYVAQIVMLSGRILGLEILFRHGIVSIYRHHRPQMLRDIKACPPRRHLSCNVLLNTQIDPTRPFD